MAGALLWARSEIRDGWRSLIVVGVLVAVVVGSVLALLAGAARAGTAPERFADSTDLAELIVFIGGEAPAELVDEIASDPRIERVVVSTVAKIGLGDTAGPESNAIIGQRDSLGGYGHPFLVSGRYPEPGSTDEILINERGATSSGIAVGDHVPLNALPCMECAAEHIGDAEVVGIVRLNEDVIEDPAGQLIVLAGPELADGRWRLATQPGTILSVHVPDGVDRARLTADLSIEVGSLGNASDQEVETETVDRAADLQRDALLLLAAVATAAGGVVVAQAASRHLQRRPSDAVVLEAVGLSRRQRVAAALGSVLPAVAAGTLAGVALAAAASPMFPLGSIRRVEPHAGFRVDLGLLVLGGARRRRRRDDRGLLRCRGAGPAPRRHRPRSGAARSPRSSIVCGCARRPPPAHASRSTPGTGRNGSP